jgi:hypothetical protein
MPRFQRLQVRNVLALACLPLAAKIGYCLGRLWSCPSLPSSYGLLLDRSKARELISLVTPDRKSASGVSVIRRWTRDSVYPSVKGSKIRRYIFSPIDALTSMRFFVGNASRKATNWIQPWVLVALNDQAQGHLGSGVLRSHIELNFANLEASLLNH